MNLFLSAEGNNATTWIFVGLLVVLVVMLLVVPMFTNKKRAKQTNDLHNSLQPGDVVKTVGGIIGTVKEIRQISPIDKEMVIETGVGDNKTTMVFDIQALYMVMSRANSSSNTIFENVEDNKPAEEAVKPIEEKHDEPAPVEEKAEEKAAEEKELVSEEKHEEPAAEQAASADAKTETEATATPAKKPSTNAPKSNGAHKPTASKSGAGTKKKSTNSAANSSKK